MTVWGRFKSRFRVELCEWGVWECPGCHRRAAREALRKGRA